MSSLDELRSFLKGEMPVGIGIGIKEVDKYLVFKRNSFTVSLARDKVGKTFFKLWYYFVMAKKHGLRFDIAARENDVWTMKLYLNQFIEATYWKRLDEDHAVKNDTWINHHFNFLEGKLDFKKIMDISSKDPKDCIWIDPYNGLDKPVGVNDHQYDYNVVRQCNQFKKEISSIDISIHPVTELNRMMIRDNHSEYNGYPEPARKWHSEGGGKWQNAVDMFFSYHRFTTHPTDFYKTMVYVENVRVQETGGRVTPEGCYLVFDYDPVICRFKFKGIDPLDKKGGLNFDEAQQIVF